MDPVAGKASRNRGQDPEGVQIWVHNANPQGPSAINAGIIRQVEPFASYDPVGIFLPFFARRGAKVL